MVGPSILDAFSDETGSTSTLSQKRQLSPISSGDGATRESKRRSVMLNLEILDCPICYGTLTIPIFQCDNGHLACASCCPKLRDKCPACASSIGHIRCRAMETVLESVFVPCPNTNLGCTETIYYGKESTHEKECLFSPCSCPVKDCNYTGSYNDLDDHYVVTHWDSYIVDKFTCGDSVSVHMNISDKILIKIESTMGILFAVQCFRESYGVYVTVNCIAPPAPEVGEFSYHLSYTVDGHTMTYESPEVKRNLEVSFQTPQEKFLLIPNSLLLGEMLDMKLCIKKLNQEEEDSG